MAVANEAHHLTEKMRHAFSGLQRQLREDVDRVDEPQLKALFEESAEVMGALAQTFEDYQRKGGPAWREAD
jgi:Rad3-related DNA helicase